MKRKQKILLAALWCCLVMTVVDGIIRPGYAVKSGIKLAFFLLIPALLAWKDRQILLWKLFRFSSGGFWKSLGLGAAVYTVILGGWWLLKDVFDFSNIAGSLSENAGVTRENFLLVSLYISFVNSLLEEFFFRGFLFMNLRQEGSRHFAYGFSAVLFALYHVAMLADWFSPLLFVLVMAGLTVGGLIFDWLNEKQSSIYPSWLVHMCANFAINTIGFLLL